MIDISEFGIKIKNIKAATLFDYNLGVRNRYDYSDAMLNNSLFSLHMMKHGLNVYKGESTRDIICLEFDFGSRSYEEELEHLESLKSMADEISVERINELIDFVNSKKDIFKKKSKDEIREDFYQNNVTITYNNLNKVTKEIEQETITYKMLYRNSSKAKTGQVMFINLQLYDEAYDWLTMGLGKKLPYDHAMIVEMSAYAPLTTSTIVNTLHIPVEDVLIVKDVDSYFTTIADVVKSDEYEIIEKRLNESKTEENRLKALNNNSYTKDGKLKYRKVYDKIPIVKKKCIVQREETDVKNTLWDGMALIDVDVCHNWINGMALLRNHFFKACAFKSNIQLFFKNYCEENGLNYNTFSVPDMFGVMHKVKDIKIITTDNAIKWKKFMSLMGDTKLDAYKYWCNKVNADGSLFGVVKTDHVSKLGSVQQLSYQMINTLPCTKEDVRDIAQQSIDYVELLKQNDDEFEKFLRKNANEINHYEMLADLYDHNHDFAQCKYFKHEKSKIINAHVRRLRKGKITVNGDNLTVCGNPYALLLYSVGEDYRKDKTFQHEQGAIQCYTTRFDNNEYLCAFRNPHNSPNNICYLHNTYSPEMKKYFKFTDNILVVNCIETDIQARANGMDFDSDFMLVTNQPTMVKYAKESYKHFPTVVNALAESGITYQNTMLDYARMDNKFAKCQRYIGESSNLAQLAMTYYWTQRANGINTTPQMLELYNNVVILACLAQVVIDSCKREYEVDAPTEIERIKKLDCMTIKKDIFVNGRTKSVPCDFPKFMKYTKDVPVTKNGNDIPYEQIKNSRNKLDLRINEDLICPMNWLQDYMDKIQGSPKKTTIDTKEFFIKMHGKANDRQMSKIRTLIEEYDTAIRFKKLTEDFNNIETYNDIVSITKFYIDEISKIKIGNLITINRLIETTLDISENVGGKQYADATKYTRKTLNMLYKSNREKFLLNFVSNE